MAGRACSAAIFLDRNSTLIRDVDYLRRAEQIEILPRVPAVLWIPEHAKRPVEAGE